MELSSWTQTLIGLAALSGSFYFLRDLIMQAFRRVADTFIYRMDVYYCDSLYWRYNNWLGKNMQYMRLNRSYRHANKEAPWPGYGISYLKLPGMAPIMVWRWTDKTKTAVYDMADCLTFQFIGGKKSVDAFIERVMRDTSEQEPYRLHKVNGKSWLDIGVVKNVKQPTDLASLDFLDDLQWFLENKQTFFSWKRGYLLFGPPGTGKTSLIAYAARKFSLPVYSLDGFGASQELLSQIDSKPALVVLEDMHLSLLTSDAEKATVEDIRKKSEDDKLLDAYSKLDLRELLNLLDGLQSFEGLIFVFTTNNKDVLNPALLREGRIDRQIEFQPMSAENRQRLVVNG